MTYLYHGGSHSLKVDAGDVLELMAAANFFQVSILSNFFSSLQKTRANKL
jgi:hypothetical protein